MTSLDPAGRLADRLRIAVIAPPYYELPPTGYGGVELVCHLLAEGLVERGHDVLLVGAGPRRTRARFVSTFDEPQPELGDAGVRTEMLHAARALAVIRDEELDIVHDHTRIGALTAAGRTTPTVVTAHGPMAGSESARVEIEAVQRWVSLVAISAAQAADAPDLCWEAVVHNGIPVDGYPLRTDKEDFLLYLGRIAATKGVHLAVAAARATGRPLVIAGSWTIEPERTYFDREIRPLLGRDVTWMGEIGMATKVDLLGRAACLVFPCSWREPFGLVLTEAMACGTPVAALRNGAVSEIVADGVTGSLCDRPEELPAAIESAIGLSPDRCRQRVTERFGVNGMVDGYEKVYRHVVRRARTDTGRARQGSNLRPSA